MAVGSGTTCLVSSPGPLQVIDIARTVSLFRDCNWGGFQRFNLSCQGSIEVLKWEIFIQLQTLSVRHQNTTVIAITELRIHEALRFMSASTRSASNLIDGESQKMPSTSPLQRWGRGWDLGGWSRQRFSYNLPTTQHNYRPINAAVEKNGAQYISQIVRQRSDPGRGIWLVYQLNIWPRGKKCEENIPRQNNWDRIKGCDGSKWPRGTFCVGILLIFASRPFLQSVEVNSLEDSIKPNIALW